MIVPAADAATGLDQLLRPRFRWPRNSTGRSQPGLVLGIVVITWVLFPASELRPKVGWTLLALTLILVISSLLQHADRLRWSAPCALLAVPMVCGVLSTQRHGEMTDLVEGAASALLLLGCVLLASHCDGRQKEHLLRLIIAAALVELCIAGASAVLGVSAPFGYLGRAGTLFGTNDLVPALAGRATGTMGHPIPFGTLMATAAVLSLFALHRWSPLLRGCVAVACIGGVALSGSRSAALALVVTLILGLLWPGVSRMGTVARVVLLAAIGSLFLWVDITALPAVTSLDGTGSLSHRLGAFDAVGRLAGRPTGELLFGSGDGSLHALFMDGLLQLDGFYAVDDQWVTTFAVGGLIGLIALVTAIAVGLIRGDRPTRPALLVVVGMFLSFDVLQWRASALLCIILLGLRNTTSADVAGTARNDIRGTSIGFRPARIPGPAAMPIRDSEGS